MIQSSTFISISTMCVVLKLQKVGLFKINFEFNLCLNFVQQIVFNFEHP